MVDTPLSREYTEQFGEAEALALYCAACEHADKTNGENRGSDEFRWAITIAIGYQCIEVDSYREHHGIHTPYDEIAQWIKDHADLPSHNGDIDYLAAFAGKYTEFVSTE